MRLLELFAEKRQVRCPPSISDCRFPKASLLPAAGFLIRLRPAHPASRGARWVGENLTALTFAAFLPGSKERDSGPIFFTPCGTEGKLWADG